MNRIFKIAGVFLVLCLASMVWAEPYRSYNKMCIAQKKGDGYWFINSKELAQKQGQIFGAQRNDYQWFFIEDEEIKAKVYDALRDAVIAAPDELYKQTVKVCPLTDTNQKLATQVSYAYQSQDKVCACVFDNKRLNCAPSSQQLKTTPSQELILFFETQGFPSQIAGLVPPVLSQAWWKIPDAYVQKIGRCANNTVNDNLIKEYEKQLR